MLAPGARDPASDKAKALMQQQPGATVDAVPAAVEWAEVVILATPSWDPSQAEAQVQALAASLGPGVKGKVLVDLVNGVSGWPKLCLPCVAARACCERMPCGQAGECLPAGWHSCCSCGWPLGAVGCSSKLLCSIAAGQRPPNACTAT